VENYTGKEPSGSLKISRGVIGTIAGMSAKEIDGVAGLAPPTASLHPPSLKGTGKKLVDVILRDDFAEISIGVALKYGAKVAETCTAIQNCVKNNVQAMTGMAVSKVNVRVARVVFPTRKPIES